MNYYLFAGNNYHPLGGRYDLQATSQSLDEIISSFYRWVSREEPTMGMCWAHICFGSSVLILAVANFDTETCGKYFRNITELLSVRYNIWRGLSDYSEPIGELNRLTRAVFLGE